VYIHAPGPGGHFAKEGMRTKTRTTSRATEAILNMVVTCVRLPECSEGRVFENFAVAGLTYFNRLEEMRLFTSRNFYSVCATICTSKSYFAKQARSILCGY
jgi:hypothetical protein